VKGFLSLVLHAHLPFVRHPEHDRFLEEHWLFEAITETYIPLLQVFEGWQADKLPARITLTLTPTLCAMLRDPLLQDRYERHLNELIGLAEQEIHRTLWQKPFNELAIFYHQRLSSIREYYHSHNRNMVASFRALQESGLIEIITCAATHALLPLLANDKPSLRAQVLIGRDYYHECFGRPAQGIWLPECAYAEGLDAVLEEAGLRWFITDAHGILHAQPKPRYAIFAPILTQNGIAAFGRDIESAKQVWSRNEGYPGDFRYRDFYRDIGFDLDLDYLRPYLPAPDSRGFTGLKYYKITGRNGEKEAYNRAAAIQTVNEHATHFLTSRMQQIERLSRILDRPPIVVCPYDAELFGHWWYEGSEFLDLFVRKVCSDQRMYSLIAPGDYLQHQPLNQVAAPAPSTWGEGGHMHVWLNEKNHWIYQHLMQAQQRMEQVAEKFTEPSLLQERALEQAARELLLAQSSDWAFILRTGTSPEYARRRVEDHLVRFNRIHAWLIEEIEASSKKERESAPDFLRWLEDLEWRDNLFSQIDYRHWRKNEK
jgi:1,4-alpha-glucan branching enzyme